MTKYGNDTHTDAQRRALAVVDAHGASAIGFRTLARMNFVHAGAARSLVARGALVEFLGPDGPMVRRRNGLTDRAPEQVGDVRPGGAAFLGMTEDGFARYGNVVLG